MNVMDEQEKERNLPDTTYRDKKESITCVVSLDDHLFWQKRTTAIKRFYDSLFRNSTWFTTHDRAISR